VRDTLAGIFADREALRFAYQDLNQLLVVLAAAFLLLGVAARRLAVPDFASRATGAFATFVTSPRQRKPKRAHAPSSQQEVLQSLRDAKIRSDAVLPTPLGEPIARAPQGRAQGARNAPSPVDAPPPSRPPRFSQPPPSGAARTAGSNRPAARKPTAAEVLLARRRGRKP
jgi:hypothetical protein